MCRYKQASICINPSRSGELESGPNPPRGSPFGLEISCPKAGHGSFKLSVRRRFRKVSDTMVNNFTRVTLFVSLRPSFPGLVTTGLEDNESALAVMNLTVLTSPREGERSDYHKPTSTKRHLIIRTLPRAHIWGLFPTLTRREAHDLRFFQGHLLAPPSQVQGLLDPMADQASAARNDQTLAP